MSRIETPRPIRGTQDMLGEQALRFGHVVETFDRVRRLYGFGRVEVPVFEPTAVFARSLGETTDVVSKEMYSFEDRGGDSVTLRPEFTAGLCRAYLTEGWQQHIPLKIATHGPLFRYERPQKGRYRQFHQLDAEVIGSAEPLADVEVLCFANQLLQELGIADGVTLTLNTLGDSISRDRWRADLVKELRAYDTYLSEDSKKRLEQNPLRILDSKSPEDQKIVQMLPTIDPYLSDEARAFFEAVTNGLDAAGIKWTRNARLVRGLDYYRHTAFEFVTDRLGAQGTVLGGGRYDGLIETLGGPATPAVGWAAGIERLAMLIDAPKAEVIAVTIIPQDEAALPLASEILALLRFHRIVADMAYAGSEKRRYERAKKTGSQRILNVGVDSSSGALATLTIRDLHVSQETMPVRGQIIRALEDRFSVSDEPSRLILLTGRS